MIILGLTGSIAMGKSTAAAMFRRLGVPVFDADHSVHRHLADDRQAIAKVAAAFPGVVREGRIDRAALAGAVFGNNAALDRLERILHPLVDADQDRFLKIAARRGAALVVLDIPLLFETGRDKTMDALVVVSAPEAVQRERVLKRPGMTQEKLDAMLARQVPDAKKRAQADFVVETDKGLDHALSQVKRVAAELRRLAEERRRK
jgi:dephospho-CoA kinase